ncbi:MAG: hypothetical protein A3D44_01715 [Candidatus Staskawiczbacteria bacterium RIFCSPHIGHO2_02_FULL_42_22]|uniref:Prepilin-type N-terminal cleavage/methylation domain-containing protein n=1 Tax=Candidatus Staskawiczbacteria bacterium RIFCSPHIGHO2_02_FULL_42_22 TaxID=1802207 RepID=A0A1G2I0N5_9BACT|nr:MAG: hypothetical protein A3D44_01715 [Candidatus Staskawiczbacteria bacterium RIFCSPHIGHO2_02_FULL_42_22]
MIKNSKAPAGSPCGSSKIKNSSNGAGYTIIELLVVIGIISLLTSIVISGFYEFKVQSSLSRVAYTFGQNMRRAQEMSLSSGTYKDSEGALHPVDGYGVYVDTLDNKKYVIYADALSDDDDDGGPGGGQYSFNPGLDYVVETINFSISEPGIIIKQINYVPSTNVSINFSPPNPITTITPFPTQNAAEVVFAVESDLTKTKTVSINTAGLVEVR